MHKLPSDAATNLSPFTEPSTDHLSNSVLDGFLRREQLAEQLGLSPRTIDRWQALRQGPPRVCIGRTVLYEIDSVREWLRSKENQKDIAPRRRRTTSAKRHTF